MQDLIGIAEDIARLRARRLDRTIHPLDDVTQDAILGLLEGLSWMREDKDVPFLKQMIRREIERGVRNRNKHRHEAEREVSHEWTFETDIDLVESLQLTERQKQILLRVLQEHNYRDIGDALGISPSAVAYEMKAIREIATKEFCNED